MTNEKLQSIKQFADKNFSSDVDEQWTIPLVTPEGEEVAVTTVWMDRSARFSLSDDQAVAEWGLANVMTFIAEADAHLRNNNH